MKIGLSFLLLLLPFAASAGFYGAPITESKWTVSVTRAECSLSHLVPGFGVAIFAQPAGKGLSFQLQPKQVRASITRASLSAAAPTWMHQSAPHQQYAVYLEKPSQLSESEQLVVHDDVAEVMLRELSAGWFPTFIYTTSPSLKSSIENQIAVSAVNFKAAFEVFSSCRNNLLPASLSDVRNNYLFFMPSSSKPDRHAKETLQIAAEYLALMADQSILITPYNSWGGKRAKKRFDARSVALKTILIDKGVDTERVTSRFKRALESDESEVINLKLVEPNDLKLLHYRPKSIAINGREKRQLSLLAAYFKEKRSGSRVVVNGHTDSRGGRKGNKLFSAKRAEVVRQYLISQGIPRNRIKIKAWGERKPVSSNRSRQGQANNRRVEIKFIG